MCSRYATLCNSRRTSTIEYYVSDFENEAALERLPGRANFWSGDDSRLLISSLRIRGITNRESRELIPSLRRLSLPILSPSLPSRPLHAQLSLPPNAHRARNRD